jgi:hypothetical protein
MNLCISAKVEPENVDSTGHQVVIRLLWTIHAIQKFRPWHIKFCNIKVGVLLTEV